MTIIRFLFIYSPSIYPPSFLRVGFMSWSQAIGLREPAHRPSGPFSMAHVAPFWSRERFVGEAAELISCDRVGSTKTHERHASADDASVPVRLHLGPASRADQGRRFDPQASARGRRPGGAWTLGRGPARRSGQHPRRRNPGRTQVAVGDAGGARERQGHRKRRGALERKDQQAATTVSAQGN